MKTTQVSFERTYSLDSVGRKFENIKVAATVALEDGDTPAAAMQEAQAIVAEGIKAEVERLRPVPTFSAPVIGGPKKDDDIPF